jgi:hypothetical protein
VTGRYFTRVRGKSCVVHVQFQTVKSTLSGHLEDVPEYLKKSEEFVGTRAALEPGLNFCKVMNCEGCLKGLGHDI